MGKLLLKYEALLPYNHAPRAGAQAAGAPRWALQ